MANPFRSVVIFPDTGGNAVGPIIQWSLDPTFNEPGPYKFELEIAETPDFSELIFTKVVDNNFYTYDDSKLHKNLGDDYIYRIKVTTAINNVYYSKNLKTGTSVSDRHKYLTASNIVRKELLRIKLYTGFPAYLLKRKTFGTINIDEIDPVSGIPLADNPTDYGTGIIGGYHKPISFNISRENVAQDRRFKSDGFGLEENYEMVARAVGFPSVENRDMIVFRSEGSRYSVQAVTSIFYPGTDLQIVQKISLKLIAPTDPLYNISVPL